LKDEVKSLFKRHFDSILIPMEPRKSYEKIQNEGWPPKLMDGTITPCFSVSNTNLEGVDFLRASLFHLMPRVFKITSTNADTPNVSIIEVFRRTKKTPMMIIHGVMRKGTLFKQQKILIGPIENENSCKYIEAVIHDIEISRLKVMKTARGALICLEIRAFDPKDEEGLSLIRKGCIIIDNETSPSRPAMIFTAYIKVCHTSTTFRVGYSGIFICRSISQTIELLDIGEKTHLSSGECCLAKFRFMMNRECIYKNDIFILREQEVSVVGVIQEVFNEETEEKPAATNGAEKQK
jgi:GTPase